MKVTARMLIYALCIALPGHAFAQAISQPPQPGMVLTSTSFPKDGPIPDKYTCKGDNISPALSWSAVPPQTQSFALVVQDTDAPGGTYTHWVAYNISSDLRTIAENGSDGMTQGQNSFGKTVYNGPCPSQGSGVHHYNFRLYALSSLLQNLSGNAVADLQDAMKGRILGQAELTGTYEVK